MTDAQLRELQRLTFGYFQNETNLANGLVRDSTRSDSAASIAGIGLALSAYPVGVENGFLPRREAVERTLRTLRFFWTSPQGPGPEATGYRGFYYHFLSMETGRREWQSEVSTIDSAILFAGALTAAVYFDRDTPEEREIRDLADLLYRRADWQWAQNGGGAVAHGWTPERGFITSRWTGYSEAIVLYALGLGSPTHPLPPESYSRWVETYPWTSLYGQELLFAGPLFLHQLSHVWIDFRGIQDTFMRGKGIDYFENSRRAVRVQQQYAMENPLGYRGYGERCWGITASDGPGPAVLEVDGIERTFFDYIARGVPHGPDDGTLAPWAVVASLPFAPELVLPALDYIGETYPAMTSRYGFKCSFNPTFPADDREGGGWISKGYYAIDQGPVVIMIENYRTGLLWELVRRCTPIANGLRRAGFTGGWLAGPRATSLEVVRGPGGPT